MAKTQKIHNHALKVATIYDCLRPCLDFVQQCTIKQLSLLQANGTTPLNCHSKLKNNLWKKLFETSHSLKRPKHRKLIVTIWLDYHNSVNTKSLFLGSEMETSRVDRPVESRFFDRPVKPVEKPAEFSFLATKGHLSTNRNILIYFIINKTFYKKSVLTNHTFRKH